MSNSTERDLENWGRWVRSGAGLQKISNPALAMMNLKCGSMALQAEITDDHALLIDRAVAKLSVADSDSGRAVRIYFIKNCDYRSLGKELGCSKDKARGIVSAGVSWIDGFLTSQQNYCDRIRESVWKN